MYYNKPKGENPYNWNRSQTKLPSRSVKPEYWNLSVIRESIKAVRALKMDFAGVDVVLDKRGNAHIIELNTTARMTTTLRTQEKYAQYFDWLAASDVRRPHFEVASNNPVEYVFEGR